MDRPCPCWRCKNTLVDPRTWAKHAAEIADDTRAVHVPVVPADVGEPEGAGGDAEDAHMPRLLDGFCMDMVDLISRNQVSATGMENVLKVLNKHIRNQLMSDVQDELPATFYQLKRRAREVAGVGVGCRTFYRHFCIDCGEIFPEDPTVLHCDGQGCTASRFNKQGRPRRKALYYDLRDKITRLLTNGFMSQFLLSDLPPMHQGDASKRDLQDVFDGNIINDLRALWPLLHVIYVAMVRPFSLVLLLCHFLGRF